MTLVEESQRQIRQENMMMGRIGGSVQPLRRLEPRRRMGDWAVPRSSWTFCSGGSLKYCIKFRQTIWALLRGSWMDGDVAFGSLEWWVAG